MDTRRFLETISIGSCFAVAAAVAAASIRHATDLDMLEGVMLVPAERFAAGKPIYGAVAILEEPRVHACYGPAYYAVLGALGKIFGSGFMAGRILSLLAATGIAVQLRRVCETTRAWLFSLAVLASLPAFLHWFSVQRVDLIAAFFAFSAIIPLVTRCATRPQIALAGACAMTVALFKPTLLAGPAAAFLATCGRRDARDVAAFVSGATFVFFVGVLLLAPLGGLDYYLFNQGMLATTPAQDGVWTANVVTQLARPAFIAPLFFFVVACGRGHARPSFGEALYLALSLALSVMSSARSGACSNYFIEFSIALAVVTGRHVFSASFLPLSLILSAMLFGTAAVEGRWTAGRMFAEEQREILWEIAARTDPDDCIDSDFPELAAAASRRLAFSDRGMYLMGPAEMRAVHARSIASREPAVIVSRRPISIEGYRLIRDFGTGRPVLLVRIDDRAGEVASLANE